MWIFLGVTSVMSGVYLFATTSSMAIARAKPDTITPPPEKLKVGDVIDAGLTLVTADAFGLSCASDTKTPGNAHCGFNAQTTPWKAENDAQGKPENIIAPYMTVDNVLFLIPGLFTQPVLKKRLEDEPPAKFTKEQMEERRFTVTCKLKVEQKFEKFKVRWANGQPWGDRDDAWVGSVSDCKMTGG
jgi:hypothetical protein